jgi:hypothetical protein
LHGIGVVGFVDTVVVLIGFPVGDETVVDGTGVVTF